MEIEPRRTIADRNMPQRPSGQAERWGFSALLAGAAMVMALAQPLEAKQSPGRQISEQALAVSRVITADSLDNVSPLELGDIPNGCLPRAVIFNDAVATKRDGALAKVVVTKEGKHAVLLCMEKNKIYAYDGYLGSFYIGSDPNILTNPDALEKGITTGIQNQAEKAAALGDFIKEDTNSSKRVDAQRARGAVINLVKQMDPKRMPMTILIKDQEGTSHLCVSFLYNGKIYLYSPQSGTASFDIPDKDNNLSELVSAVAVKKYGSGLNISGVSLGL